MTNETISGYVARVADAGIAQVNPYSGYTLGELLNIWNDATNPAAFRSDAEHEENRAVAREAKAELNRRFVFGRDYREFSNGMLWPISR